MMTPETSPQTKDSLVICTHNDYCGASVDFAELWEGRLGSHAADEQGASIFRGRPYLANALVSAIRAEYSDSKPDQIRTYLSHLRAFWRFLECFETSFQERIETLEDLEAVHGALWVRPTSASTWKRPGYGQYTCVRRLIDLARTYSGHRVALAWPMMDRAMPARPDILSREQARALNAELKQKAYAILTRWASADTLANQGQVLLDQCRPSTAGLVAPADCHATYRAVIRLSGNPAPSYYDLRNYLRPPGAPRSLYEFFSLGIVELQAGLYPTVDDIWVFLYLFLLRTGWNPQVAIDIDTSSNDWATPIGDPASRLWHLQSAKVRGGNWQDAVSSGKQTTGAYQIIKILINRTSALRALALSDPSRCKVPAIATRSPWLAVSNWGVASGVSVVEKVKSSKHLRSIVCSRNSYYRSRYAAESSATQDDRGSPATTAVMIPEDIVATDLRDAYITHSFIESRYSWVIAMWAAGHRYSSSTRIYLRSRAWQVQSSRSVTDLTHNLFEEIKNHRVVDPVLLRAICEGNSISEIQRHRWLERKDRTYVGAGCKNPRNPPAYVSPAHPHDGHAICTSQARCTFCPHAIFFNDSLPRLAMRAAELEHIFATFSLAALSESSFPLERDALQALLEEWPKEEVDSHVAQWRSAIAAGTHRIISLHGAYGQAS